MIKFAAAASLVAALFSAMPVSITLGNRFKEAEVAAEPDPLGDMMSFLAPMLPHLLSIGIGVLLIYLNKMVNDRTKANEVETTEVKTRSVEMVPEPEPVSEPVVQAPKPVVVEAPKKDEPNKEVLELEKKLKELEKKLSTPKRKKKEEPVQKLEKQLKALEKKLEEREEEPEDMSVPEPVEEEKDSVMPMLQGLAKKHAPVDVVSVTSTQSSEAHLNTECLKKLKSAFPNALANTDLIEKVASSLAPFGYGETTLLATSLCCDEVNRVLDEQFHKVYEHHFSMGGLAGFPFGGVTSFGAMAHHIPDGGSCLIVYGPHVGIDSHGVVGMIDRRGRKNNGACCGSAADAANHVSEVRGASHKPKPPVRPLDAQQAFVRSMLMPYGKRLENSKEATVELPYALYDAMDDMMRQIVTFGAGEVAGEGKIALLGGIQINTPEEHSDYFLPLTFEIRDNHNLLLENLTWW